MCLSDFYCFIKKHFLLHGVCAKKCSLLFKTGFLRFTTETIALYNSKMPIIIKNMAKISRSTPLSIRPTKIADRIATIIAGIATHNETLKFINLFFACIISATIPVGINTSKFTACAICCSSPKNNISSGISRVPPPIPIPLTIPPTNPAKMYAKIT